jgi:hypothetical protein
MQVTRSNTPPPSQVFNDYQNTDIDTVMNTPCPTTGPCPLSPLGSRRIPKNNPPGSLQLRLPQERSRQNNLSLHQFGRNQTWAKICKKTEIEELEEMHRMGDLGDVVLKVCKASLERELKRALESN